MVRLDVVLPSDLHADLKAEATQRGLSLSEFVRQLLLEGLAPKALARQLSRLDEHLGAIRAELDPEAAREEAPPLDPPAPADLAPLRADLAAAQGTARDGLRVLRQVLQLLTDYVRVTRPPEEARRLLDRALRPRAEFSQPPLSVLASS